MGLLWAYWLGCCLLKQCDSHLDLKLRLGFTIEERLDKTLFLSSPGKWCFLFKWISTTNSRIRRRLTINSRRCIWTCSMHVFFIVKNRIFPNFVMAKTCGLHLPCHDFSNQHCYHSTLTNHHFSQPAFSLITIFTTDWSVKHGKTTRAAQIYGGFSWFFMFVTLW